MQYIRDLWHDVKLCVATALVQWHYTRKHLRRGSNPDEASF